MVNTSRITMNRRIFAQVIAASAALSAGQTLAQGSTPVSGEWTFTDDKGFTYTLPAMPERIAMDVNVASSLWDFGIRPTALFGWNVLADGTLGDAGGNIDPEGIDIVGDVNETMNVEKLINSDPDLVITLTWVPDDPIEYWRIVDEQILAQVQDVAPLLAMSATGRADENTLRIAELAASLGADLESPELATAREGYDASLERFAEMIKAKPDLTVLFMSAVTDNTYIANPSDWADLNMFTELGLKTVSPDVEPGMYWQTISHELALEFPADVIFTSSRSEALTIDDIKALPSWGQHPAVKAGQIFLWNQDFIQSYQGMTLALDDVTDGVLASEKAT